MKKTKIVATVSNRNCSPELLRRLHASGMDVVRLNTAHMQVAEMEEMVRMVRGVSDKIAIMVDTKGPNIRTCNLAGPLELHAGDSFVLSGAPVAPGEGVQVNYPRFAADVKVGNRVVFDDGDMEAVIVSRHGDAVTCEARIDGAIRDRKSINVPDARMKVPALTARDREFIDCAIRNDIAFIAHSFVRSRDDVMAVRSLLDTADSPIQIIAKIENREGVDHLNDILEVADGIMVARGDLGIEIPLEEVPTIQKDMIHACMLRGKVVITATQMLQSMEENPRPTRAEVSDVANAVFDGTDAVMLSGETAQGRYPVESVAMMSRILEEAEKAPARYFTRISDFAEGVGRRTGYVLKATVRAAESLPVKAIICNTASGRSARLCSSFRADVPIFALSHHPQVVRQLALCYGVYPEHNSCIDNPIELSRVSTSILLNEKLIAPEDLVVLISKNSERVDHNNLCCIATVEELQS